MSDRRGRSRTAVVLAGYALAFWSCFGLAPRLAAGNSPGLALCCVCSLVGFVACEFGHLVTPERGASDVGRVPGRAACLAFALAAACAAIAILVAGLVTLLALAAEARLP